MRVRTGVSTCPVLPIFPAPRALRARDVGHGFREESARQSTMPAGSALGGHATSSAPELSLRLGGNVRGLAELGGRASIASRAVSRRAQCLHTVPCAGMGTSNISKRWPPTAVRAGKRRGVVRYCSCVLEFGSAGIGLLPRTRSYVDVSGSGAQAVLRPVSASE
jgi:hypothetical protein